MFSPMQDELLFAEEEVTYAGQPVGLVVAQTHEQAKYAANLVEINYKDVQKPILTIKEVKILTILISIEILHMVIYIGVLYRLFKQKVFIHQIQQLL